MPLFLCVILSAARDLASTLCPCDLALAFADHLGRKPVLVKRGKELHEPDRMYLNPNQILFVETVGPNSKVAQLIAQAHQ